jgi:hypothetical protein
MTISTYIFMAVYSCVYAYNRLSKPGMSEEIRKFFLRKHISYVAAFVAVWTINLMTTYF